jgi:hypothetical protein
MNAGACVALALLAVPAAAEPPADHAPVMVLRGGHAGAANGSRTLEQGVVIMRPAPGSFMRETTRLAAQDKAREPYASLQISVYPVESRWHDHYLLFPSVIGRDAGKPPPRKTHPVAMLAPR